MTLRNNCTPAQLRAHMILDKSRDGFRVSENEIRWALYMLGEPALSRWDI